MRNLIAAAAGVAGVSFAIAAIFWSADAIEQAFLGRATGALEWGPNLFRLLLLFHGMALLGLGIVVATRHRTSAPSAQVTEPRSSGTVWLVLAALCVIGLGLRLWKLDTDLWLDEVFTLTDFLRRPWLEIVTMFPSQNQHPLYSLLARASLVTLGESAATIRLPAALFGAASIWALFLLGRRVVSDREALLASAIMTFSYHHIWFSQNARGYIGLLFFGTLATWLWIEATEHGRTARWLWYGVSAWLGVWMHMTMVFVLAAHGLVYVAMLLARRSTAGRVESGTLDAGFWWKAPAVWLFAGTLVIQVHALALPEFFRSALHEVSLESEWVNPLWVFQESARRLADAGLGSVVVIAGLATILFGLWSIGKRDWRIAVLLIAPGVLGGGTMLALGHNLWPRFFFFCMGFVLLLAVRGTVAGSAWLFSRLRLPTAARLGDRVGAAACLLLIAASVVIVPRSYLPKQDFSGAKRWLEQAKAPDDPVVTVGLAGEAYRRYYAPEWTYVDDRARLEAVQRGGRSVYVVYTLPVHLQAWFPDIWSLVQREYEVVRVFPGTLGDGQIVVCKRRGNGAG